MCLLGIDKKEFPFGLFDTALLEVFCWWKSDHVEKSGTEADNNCALAIKTVVDSSNT